MRTLLTGLLLGAILCALPHARCEEGKTDADEAKVAEEEEKAVEKLPGEVVSPLRGIHIKGVFQAQASNEEKPAVMGFFKNEKQSYLVKPDNDEIRKKLLEFNGKTLVVFGKERNRGKYLIVMGIVEEPEGATNRRKKKGF